MSRTPFKLVSALLLGLAMWVVPSLGTQGVGTIGRQLPHPDRVLIATGNAGAESADAHLHAADFAVRNALPY